MRFSQTPSEPRILLGLGSGTSADGTDLALIEVQGVGLERKVRSLGGGFRPYPKALANEVRTLDLGDAQAKVALSLKLGQAFGEAGVDFLTECGVSGSELAAAGSHGQTVFHHDSNPADGSIQLGDLRSQATLMGCPVVGDFRQADLEVGGQGAPISPYADWILHHQLPGSVAVLNLGGLANITLLHGASPPQAWDSGPANGPLDEWMRRMGDAPYDEGGQIALEGSVIQPLFDHLVQDSYFSRSFPKSTGLERFGSSFVEKMHAGAPEATLPDLLRTACALAGWAVTDSLKAQGWRGGTLYLAGGGAHNSCLIKEIRDRLGSTTELCSYSELGWDPDLREAVCFALLADAFLFEEASTWPSTTGATCPAVLGTLVRESPS